MAEADEGERRRLDLVRNERTKLRATYLNGLAIAVFAVGGFAPVVSYLSSGTAHYSVVAGLGAVCVLCSWLMHILAQRSLKELVS